MIGYFKVGRHTNIPFGFIASDVVLLPKDQAIPIPYNNRGVPASWGNSSVKQDINRVFRDLMSLARKDISTQYQAETKSIMAMLSSKTGKNAMLTRCETCRDRISCYWGKKSLSNRKKVLTELYGRIKSC
jgi:hypothetical protein